jgi:hypothetical protein
MKNCSYCGRENGDEVAQCRECGTEFVMQSTDVSATEPIEDPARVAANKRVFWGAAWCLGGLFVTVLSYAAAANSPVGGTYIVAWGAIIFGAIQIFRGIVGHNAKGDQAEKSDAGDAALAAATRLETQGRIQEALNAYQRIADDYPGTEAGHDARKSIESLQQKRG